MVILRLLVLLMLCLLGPAQAARLHASVDNPQSELGAPIQLRLTSDQDLSEFNLEVLKKDFEVFSTAVSSSTRQGKLQSTLEATLYPLRSGKLSIPTLEADRARSKAIVLDILPAPVQLRAWIAPKSPMERAPITLTLDILDDGSLSWEPPKSFDATHLHLAATPEITHESDPTFGQRHRYRWTMLALKEGGLAVHFPMLDAYKFGQRLRFPLAPVTFRAQAAPRYLPLHVPVGKPRIQFKSAPVDLRVGEPVRWSVTVEAPGLSPEGLNKLLRIPDTPGLRWYAPEIVATPIDGREGLRLQLSFVAEDTRPTHLPAWHLPYFDPQTQRLEAITFPAQSLTISNPTHARMAWVGFTLLGISGLVWLFFKVRPVVLLWHRKRAWLRRIAQAQDGPALYHALTRHAPHTPRSLQVYQAVAPPGAISQLEKRCYGAHSDVSDWAALKQHWIMACAKLPLQMLT